MKTRLNKILALLCCLFLFAQDAESRHIAGGELAYTYLGAGSNATSARYRITLRLYRDCQSTGAELDPIAAITIFQNGQQGIYQDLQVNILRIDQVQLTTPGPCIDNAPIVCYQIGIYTVDTELPFAPQGYTIAYQRCCRIENISNINNSSNTGGTYTATIPGTVLQSQAPVNSTPVFNGSDTVLICQDNPFIYDFSARDPEGDSLVYVFDEAYDFANQQNPRPNSAQPPPYNSLPYSFGFTAAVPMGRNVSLDRNTGIMSGIAPGAGIYVVTVSVQEWRNGQEINRHRKDLHVKVAACSIASADLQPEYVTCDGFTLTFQNRSNSPLIKTFSWDFGLTSSTTDTSNLERPTFTFPDTGVYRVRLITNRGQDCSDTAFTLARVFPGFFPGFDVQDGCRGVPLQFTDRTSTQYGVVDKWRWNFGNPQVNPDTSRLQNPTYVYPTLGTYQIQMIVSNSKGCTDTVEKTVNVLARPPLSVSNDTILCNLDTIQLRAVGVGAIQWSPAVAISDPNVANPLVSPDLSIKYYVTLTSAPGCVNTDSVFIDVRSQVNLDAGNDTIICLTDTMRLNPRSDGLTYRWQPVATLTNPNSKNPTARPVGTTVYSVIANIGRCQASDAITVTTVPYPRVQMSNDVTICFGDSTQITASGGDIYRWIPSTGLSNNSIPNPIAKPSTTTSYRVAVRDNEGCPKASFDSVLVTVIPPVPAFAGNDTAIVVGQTLQLNARGGEFYQWLPTTGLSNPNIPDPEASLDADQRYVLRVTTADGCFAFDTLNVRVFKTDPDIFVPTAFTPNGDGLNDLLLPIPAGISQYEYFRVYNRYGQLVFSTTEVGKGWDGKIAGKEQGSDSFAWYVKGRDYTGKTIFKKGVSTLIR
jgi:gliding motility-associated-like protein